MYLAIIPTMKIKCLRSIVVMLLIPVSAVFGQTGYYVASPSPRGDSTRAHLAQHHPAHEGPTHVVQLGYIDTNVATRKEILDNMLIGLRVLPADSTKIVSYTVISEPKGTDVIGPIEIDGDRLPRSFLGGIAWDDWNKKIDTIYTHGKKSVGCLYHDLHLYLHTGDRILFDVQIQRGNEKTLLWKKVYITVR